MPWNPTSPVGNISVKANRTLMNQNTTYIETTMGNTIIGTNTNTTRDHFWNVGGNEDGRHRFINSPAFTVGGNPADPLVGAGMDSVLFLRLTNAQAQWFNLTSGGDRYQVSPNIISGTRTISSSSSYVDLAIVPNDVYGEIFMWTNNNGENTGQTGFFKTKSNVCDAWALTFTEQGSTSSHSSLKFGNGSEASGLAIRVRRDESGQTQWNYRITYRAI